jgi:Family of unknown function (DUF6286)
MSAMTSVYSRVTRRELSSPRSVLAITLAVIVIVLCAYAAIETVLSMTGQPGLLAAPAVMATAIVDLPTYAPAAVLASGVVVVIVGVVLLIVALTPGWRPRHTLPTGRIVTVVDNEVIASALARRASFEGNVDPDDAKVSVSRRRAVVTLTATSGTTIATRPVNDVMKQELESYRLAPRLTSKVVVGSRRKVGA